MRIRSSTRYGRTATRWNGRSRIYISPTARALTCGDCRPRWTPISRSPKWLGKASHIATGPALVKLAANLSGESGGSSDNLFRSALLGSDCGINCLRSTCVGGRWQLFQLPTNRESGVNPGRPRRCNRAQLRNHLESHYPPRRMRRQVSQKLESQKTYQRVACSWLRGTATASD